MLTSWIQRSYARNHKNANRTIVHSSQPDWHGWPLIGLDWSIPRSAWGRGGNVNLYGYFSLFKNVIHCFMSCQLKAAFIEESQASVGCLINNSAKFLQKNGYSRQTLRDTIDFCDEFNRFVGQEVVLWVIFFINFRTLLHGHCKKYQKCFTMIVTRSNFISVVSYLR